MSSVLCLLASGFEEIEFTTPVDLMRRAGITVTAASIGDIHVTGRSGITLHADARLSDLEEGSFDCLFLPGGPGVAALRKDGRAASLARAFTESGRLVAAICAAPLILDDAGLLSGRRFTSHPSTADALPSRSGDETLVVDKPLITSRGAGTALQFGLQLISELCGAEAAASVKSAIAA